MKYLSLILAVILVAVLSGCFTGCASTSPAVKETGKIVLRIVVRHAVAELIKRQPGTKESIQLIASALATAKTGISPAALQAEISKIIAKKAKSPTDAADLADLSQIILAQYQPIYDERIAGALNDSEILSVLTSVASVLNEIATPTRSIKSAKTPKVLDTPKVSIEVD